MNGLLSSTLSNVPSGTANLLSYVMVLVVAVFLVSGPIVTYYYWKKNKEMKSRSSPSAGANTEVPPKA